MVKCFLGLASDQPRTVHCSTVLPALAKGIFCSMCPRRKHGVTFPDDFTLAAMNILLVQDWGVNLGIETHISDELLGLKVTTHHINTYPPTSTSSTEISEIVGQIATRLLTCSTNDRSRKQNATNKLERYLEVYQYETNILSIVLHSTTSTSIFGKCDHFIHFSKCNQKLSRDVCRKHCLQESSACSSVFVIIRLD